MRVAGQDECIDTNRYVFFDPRRHRLRIADQRGAGAAADQTDAGPQIGAHFELVATAAVQFGHAPLTDRIHAREHRLRLGDSVVADILDQFVRRRPGLSVGFPHDHMQPDAKRDLAALGLREFVDCIELVGDKRRRLAPGQVLVDGFSGDRRSGRRRTAEEQRRMRLLIRRKQQLAIFDGNMLALEVHGVAGEQVFVDGQEFTRDLVAFVMRQEYSVAFVLGRVAAGDDIDQQPPVRDAVERRGHAGRHCRRLQPWPHRHEIAELPRQRHQRGCDDPGILATPAGRQQHAEIAEIVRCLGNLP